MQRRIAAAVSVLCLSRGVVAAYPLHPEPVILAKSLDSPDIVASLIDHTLLKPEATPGEISQLCREASEYAFHSVCVNPFWVRLASRELAQTQVRVCATAGFPLGANETGTKLVEARAALEAGALEIDMVQNIGALRAGNTGLVRDEIGAIAALVHEHGALLKVILETCLLIDEEKREACRLAAKAGADFVKTSTGFSKRGACAEDVQLMRHEVGDSLGVKAAGGIRTISALREMVSAGANRIGTSSGVNILAELRH